MNWWNDRSNYEVRGLLSKRTQKFVTLMFEKCKAQYLKEKRKFQRQIRELKKEVESLSYELKECGER